jgi:hypothetical protein
MFSQKKKKKELVIMEWVVGCGPRGEWTLNMGSNASVGDDTQR